MTSRCALVPLVLMAAMVPDTCLAGDPTLSVGLNKSGLIAVVDTRNLGQYELLSDVRLEIEFRRGPNILGKRIYTAQEWELPVFTAGKKFPLLFENPYPKATGVSGKLSGAVGMGGKVDTVARRVSVGAEGSVNSAGGVKGVAKRKKGKPSSGTLAVPVVFFPPEGIWFDHVPRSIALTWKEVAGARSYSVELQIESGGKWHNLRTVKATHPVYNFHFNGAQRGRWRVWANGAWGKRGKSSAWRVFGFRR